MRFSDLLLLPLLALWQQKSRTVLTTAGVVFGAFVLAASLSVNDGVQAVIDRESRRYDALRRIEVHADWGRRGAPDASDDIVVEGKMSDDKRARIREALASQQRLSSDATFVFLNEELLEKLAAIEHVEVVEPHVWLSGFAMLGDESLASDIESVRPNDPTYLRRVVAGRLFERPEEQSVVVGEFLLYRMGLVDDEAVESALGKKLRIEIRENRPGGGFGVYVARRTASEPTRDETVALQKIARKLPELLDQLELSEEEIAALRLVLKEQEPPAEDESDTHEVCATELTIVGVMRMPTADEEKDRNWWESLGGRAQLVLPYRTAADLFFRVPGRRDIGVNSVTVVVDREEHVKTVLAEVRELGVQGHAAIEFIERERLIWLLVFGGMTCIAGVALLVAAMGIANTMLMSVLERTREIGIMKAVGAAGGQITSIFLVEGAVIGVAGAGLGLLLAWLASIPGDAWVRSMVARDMDLRLRETLFVFPWWLVATVIVFTAAVTTLAAVYPARRAARIDPVAALKYE